MGVMMISSARANRPLGIASLIQRRPVACAASAQALMAAMRPTGFPVSPSKPATICYLPRCPSSVGIEDIALAAHRLQIDGVRRVTLDLAAQPVDLHVDGALAAGIVVT